MQGCNSAGRDRWQLTHQLQQVLLKDAPPLLHSLRRKGAEPPLLRELEQAQLIVALLEDLQVQRRRGQEAGQR